MRGTLLCLRTKCNQAVSLLSEPCAGELDVLHRALQRFEQGLAPPCVVTRISPCILAQQIEISLSPCTTCFSNELGSTLYPNLSKLAIK